jgi:Phosphotransferase enzyme family
VLIDLARQAGTPVPRYEAVFDVGDLGAAVIQERAAGRLADTATVDLIDGLIALAELRRGVLAGTEFANSPMPLYLSKSGPGYCLHEPLRSYSRRSRALLEAIEAAAGECDDIEGDDLVHFDYHLGNVLVDPDRPHLVTAILDWDSTRPGSIGVDFAILAFDLTLRGTHQLQHRVEEHFVATTDPELRSKIWAHAALRLVDWSIRHHSPPVTEHWLQIGEEHMTC